jgi:uncharacterized protein YkwD
MARKALALALPALIAAGLLVSTGVAPASSGGPCPDVNTPARKLSPTRMERSVFCLINKRRAQHGVRTLTPNRLLHQAAVGYTDSMMVGRFFSHYGDFQGHPDSSDPIQRLREAGYIRPGYAWIVGEDLRWSYEWTSTPAQVVQAWMDSPIHRFYLLKWHFDELGVGAVRGYPDDPSDPNAITVTAEFGFRTR